MKIKADKKVKSKDYKLHLIKKSKSDITREEKKAPVMHAVSPHTFAEKKVLAVKKKNKKEKKTLFKAEARPIPHDAGTKIKRKKPLVGEENALAKRNVSTQQQDTSSKVKRKGRWKKNPEKKPELVESSLEDTGLPDVLVSKKSIEAALKACKKALDEGFDKKKNLFGEDMKYGLQIASVKIPDVPSRNCRLKLPHPIYHNGDDICLIVKDLARGRKQDHEQTLHHWEDKLRELGIDYVTQVIPFQQLKQDYRQYEMKLKLVNRFDRFLVDARINGHVYNFLGTGFIRRCKNPTPVVLEKEEKIVKNLHKALSKVTYKQTNTGRINEIQFATHKMPVTEAVENAEALIETLKTQYPGGWLNIRTIYLKPMIDIQLTFPLYVSKIDPNLVQVPKITGPRERFEKTMNEQLLQSTRNKYKFESGNLVRVPYDERRIIGLKKKGAFAADDTNQAEGAVDEDEAEQSSDDEMDIPRGRGSDTEQSDPGDEEDN